MLKVVFPEIYIDAGGRVETLKVRRKEVTEIVNFMFYSSKTKPGKQRKENFKIDTVLKDTAKTLLVWLRHLTSCIHQGQKYH